MACAGGQIRRKRTERDVSTDSSDYRSQTAARSALTIFWAGVRAILPIIVGVVPFGLLAGAVMVDAGIPPLIAQAMSAVIFAGASQVVFAQLVAGGAPSLVLIVSAVVVNLRHMLYSASAAPWLGSLSPGWKAILAYLLTDEAYAVSVTTLRAGPPEQARWHLLGSGLTLWIAWQASTAIGIAAGPMIPDSWSLDFTIPLTFIAVVVPMIRTRAAAATAATAGVVALLTMGLPFRLGLIVSAALALLTGWLFFRLSARGSRR